LVNSFNSSSISKNVYAGAADALTTLVLPADIAALTTDIQQAYADFQAEQGVFVPNAGQIDAQLNAAILFSKAASAMANRTASNPTIRQNLQRVATQLAIAEDYMLSGQISPQTLSEATATNTRVNVQVTAATLGQGNSAGPVSNGSQATINSNSTNDPFSSQTKFGIGSTYDVEGVAVTVNGISVPVLYISPHRVKFFVTPEIGLGSFEVIVTSQEGYVSKGTVTVSRNNSKLLTDTDDDNSLAVAVNSVKLTTTIAVNSPENFGADKQTRLIMFGTGVSGSATNSDPSNDVHINGTIRENFAESVSVEARLSDGRVFMLPVEFAGEQGQVPGLDQINVRLIPELRGAGTVELTLIINGERSNAPRIVIQ